ncbi:MAG: DNA repair protein RecN [Verrucomicrobiales bacterium]|nr:DNA repair protein RecN [Verrucomicrobiales bacterium]
MLSVLKIRNLALVESLTWEIGAGLVCVTGETGAGKSVIVGAVKLVLGERADRSLVRTGSDACTAEALFHLHAPAAVDTLLEQHGLDPTADGELVIRRTISAAGSNNKQFINGSPTTLTTLKAIGQHLVDLHGPHDHQSLLSRERQLAMLDAYAANSKIRGTYHTAYQNWRNLQDEHDQLLNAERASAQELDLLRFQVDEISAAELQPNEEDETEARFKIANNAQRLIEEANASLGALSGITGSLSELQRHLASLEKTDPDTAEFTAAANTASVELSELETNLTDYLGRLEIDPAEANALEQRLDTIQTLKRKYGNTVAEVLGHLAAAEQKLERTENRGAELERLETDAANALANAGKTGKKLTASRKKAAPKLAADISAHLAELGFKRATFESKLEPGDPAAPTPHGLESCDFLFAPNPGEPIHPLRQTASSGEMSRTMLAIKSALVKEDNIPLLIFDEIDANVGGEIATAVGRKMAELGKNHQVVSITHLPQVASLASSHYVVTKDFDEKTDRTTSTLTEVKKADRVTELARMLGGESKSSLAHAKSLLSSNARS